MTSKERKIKAQDLLMEQIAKVGYSISDDLSEKEKELLQNEIQKQGNRLARVFGFKEMFWY